jgi:hypothetical protein
MDLAGESPFRGDFIAGKLRYSNSEFTEIVEETLTPGRRDRGEIRVTFSGIFIGYELLILIRACLLHSNEQNKRERCHTITSLCVAVEGAGADHVCTA